MTGSDRSEEVGDAVDAAIFKGVAPSADVNNTVFGTKSTKGQTVFEAKTVKKLDSES